MKKNIFKKLGGAFLGLSLGLGVVAGISSAPKASEVKAASGDSYTFTDVSGTSADQNWSFSTEKNGGSSDPAFNTKSGELRLYPKNKLTITGKSGVTLTSAEFVCVINENSKKVKPTGWSVNKGTISTFSDTATSFTVSTISDSSFSLTIAGSAGNVGLKSVNVSYTGGGGETTNYTVTFDANGHGTAPAAVTVASGSKVPEPTAPTASGYTFGGWYREAGCTNAYDFNAAVTSSFTLYAKWTENGGPTPPTPSGSYILVTSLSDLKNGDNVVIATGKPANGVTGVTGFNGTKDATVSTTLSEFLEYTVEVSGTDYYLKDTVANNYIAKPTGNEFKYGTKGAIAVDADGHMMSNSRYLCVNSGSYRFYTSIGSYTPFYLYKIGQLATLKSISTLSGTVSAKTGDTSWKIENVSVTGVLSDSASVVDVSKYVDVSVVENVPEIEQDGTKSVTLKATGKTETTVTKSVSVTATLKFVNPYHISQIYGAADNTVVTIDGIYMGDVRDAMIIMDGEYGANIYYGTGNVPAHSYVPGETKLTVTGTTSLFKGLEEVKPTSVSVLTDADRIAKLSTPEVYICTGSETSANPELASRKTNATGYVTAIADASGNKNVTLNVGGKSVAIFVGSVYATEDVMSKLNASKDNTSDIVVEGFTSFYNGNFQIQFTGLVEQKADYTADDFAAELLELTDAICEGYDGVTNNKDALGSVWLVLQDADHYLGLVASEQEKVEQATADASGSDLEKAVARYDYLVGKYPSLTKFIDNRPVSEVRNIGYVNHDNNSSTTIIIVVSVVSLTTLAALLVIKRRKAIEK